MLFSCGHRSHAILTSTVEHRRKWDVPIKVVHDSTEDSVSAKLHVVHFAGSEQAKRTGADGVQFKDDVVFIPTSRLLY